MNALPTIPRDTLLDALRLLGFDDMLDDITQVTITPAFVDVVCITPNPYVPRFRVVDECPSCHASGRQPHTEYCRRTHLIVDKVGVSPEVRELAERMIADEIANDPEAVVVMPEPWVDNGCRCPNPDHEHLPGCPTLQGPTAEYADKMAAVLPNLCPDCGHDLAATSDTCPNPMHRA